jgi:hypothetical protein
MFIVNVFLKNSDFSEAYALQNHAGEDAPENVRYEWEDEFRVPGDFSSVEILRNQTYTLKGERGDQTTFSYDIKELIFFMLTDGQNTAPLIFPESAIELYEIDLERKRIRIELNDLEDIENPAGGLYFTSSQFPKELKN